MSPDRRARPYGLPRGTDRAIVRVALLHQLDRLAALTVIHAPPGYGKSSLAAMWARHRYAAGDGVVWMTANAELDDRDAFIRSLGATLAAAGLTNGDGDLVEVIDHGDAERLIVVVDDAGYLTDTRLLEEMASLLDRAPSLHLVLCTRAPHPLVNVAAHRQLDVAHITTDDLAVSEAELGDLARVWGSTVAHEEIGQVFALCGGWLEPSKRVLAQSGAGVIRTSTAESYLREVVLPQLDQIGLLDTALALALPSTVDPIHLAAANRRSATDAGAPAVSHLGDRLRLGGYLAAIPGATPQWGFVPLLRTTLFDVANHHGDRAAADHRLFATALYDGGGDHGRVLDHARAGEHWELLSQIWARHPLALLDHHLAAARRAYTELPAEAGEQQPVLVLASAVLREAEARAPGHGMMERAYAVVAPTLREGLTSRSEIDEVVAAMTSVMVEQRRAGDLTAAKRTGESVAAELARSAGLGELAQPGRVALFHHQWSLTAMIGVDLSEAIAIAGRAYDTARIGDGHLIAAFAAAHLALLHVFVGSQGEGDRWLTAARAIDLGGHPFATAVRTDLDIVEAYLAADRLAAEPARRMIDDGAAFGTELWPFAALAATAHSQLFDGPAVALTRLEHLRFVHRRELGDDRAASWILDRCTVDTLLALGEVNRAERMMLDLFARHSPREVSWLRVPFAQLALITGDTARAKRRATAALWAADVVARDRADAAMIAAAAAWRLGETTAAVDSLRQAVVLAEQLGSLHCYLVIPPADLRAIANAAGATVPAEVAAHLASFGSIYPADAHFVELSPRERDVLQAMREHGTVAAIAQALHLSVNTVKKHLTSINAKFGVHDRAAALVQAERLGLLEPRGPQRAVR